MEKQTDAMGVFVSNSTIGNSVVFAGVRIMRRWQYVLSVWLLVCTSGVGHLRADDETSQPKNKDKAQNEKWALLIGVNDYASLTKLNCCVQDQTAFKTALMQSGFPEDQIFLLCDDAKENRYKPFRNNIEKQLDLLLRMVRPGDMILVGFSGHGVTDPNDRQSYLCPADADLDKPAETMLSLDGLYQRLNKCPADFKLMIVDACRNFPQRPGKRSARSPSAANKDFLESLDSPPRGLMLITSCEPGEQAQEDEDELKHGVFMHHLLLGLKGGADRNQNAKVSVMELYEFAEVKTAKYVARKYNDSQHPRLRGEWSGTFEFPIARPETFVAKASTTPSNPPALPNPLPSLPKPSPLLPKTSSPSLPNTLRPALKYPNDEATTQLVYNMLRTYHISQRPIDDEISTKLLDRFLKTIDPQKMYFTQADINGLSKYKTELDDQLKVGSTKFAYDVWEMFLQRVERQLAIAQQLILVPHDFTIDESMELAVEKIPFAANEDELNDRWRQRIKLELLNIKLEAEGAATKDRDKLGTPTDPTRLQTRYRRVLKSYLETDDAEKLELYLTALTQCFDPHSAYISPQSEAEFKSTSALNLEGIGAALRSENGFTIVNEVLPYGAAAKDGRLKAGDRILAVGQENGEIVELLEMKLGKVVRLIRGQAGTKVRLLVKKESSGEEVTYEVVRQKSELANAMVRGELLEADKRLGGRRGKIGVINIPSFYRDFQGFQEGNENAKSTAKDVQNVLKQFQRQGGVDVLIIDLRSNPGGALSEAIDVSSLFIDKGPVMQIKDYSGKVKSFDDDSPGAQYNGPLVVICNKLSESVSEIFAGVIQDYQRGIIVGDTTTFGKGTVQNVLPVSSAQNRGSLKLTIQQFYRVNGDSTQHAGVKSDIVLPSILDHMNLSEPSLQNALAFDRVHPVSHDTSDMVTSNLVSLLRDRSERRVATDPLLIELRNHIDSFLKRKNRNTISLNESVLRSERALSNQETFESNRDRQTTRSNDISIFADDAYNNEVLQISLDYATLLRNPQAAR